MKLGPGQYSLGGVIATLHPDGSIALAPKRTSDHDPVASDVVVLTKWDTVAFVELLKSKNHPALEAFEDD